MAQLFRPAGVSPPAPFGTPKLNALTTKGQANQTATRTLRCRTVAKGRLVQLNYIRNLPPQPTIEVESEGLLGEAVAPSASEALLAALGSCLAVGIHASALAQRIPIRSLELDVEADINAGPIWEAGELNPKTIGFESVRVIVRLDADAPYGSLEAVVRSATLSSPVANTIFNPVHLDVTLSLDSMLE